MRRLLSLALVFVIILGVALFGACADKPEESHTEHTYETTWTKDATHHYKKCSKKDCDSVSEKAEHSMENGKCTVCGYDSGATDDGGEKEITATTSTIKSIMSSLKDGSTVKLSAGPYMTITVESVENVTIIAEKDATVSELVIKSGVKNLTIENVEFYNYDTTVGGINIASAIDGLTVKNCSFTKDMQISALIEGVKNVSFNNCKFLDISNQNNLSAVVIRYVENLSFINTVFDGVDYNALQIGSGVLKGNFTVTGCTFKDINDRTFNIVCPEETVVWNISGNKIYKNTKSKSGRYFKGEKKIVVGANAWEEIPDLNVDNFAIEYSDGLYRVEGVTYNVSEQTVIND